MTTGTGFIGIGKNETNSFQGIFLGNQKVIKNIYIDSSVTEIRMSLFPCIKNANIQDLTITGKYIVKADAAGLAGTLYGKNTITNCHNQVVITNTTAGFSIAGLLATFENNSEAVINGCSNSADITNVSSTGGLVALILDSVKLTISNCYNTGNITSTEPATSGSKYDWTATAGLVIKDARTKTKITIDKSYNAGTISGVKNVAGLIASSKGECTITSCYNVGSIIAKGQNTSGILGEKYTTNAEIQNSYNVGEISGHTYTGAIVGNLSNVTCNVSTAYYLNNTNSAIGSDTTTIEGSKTDEFMKSDDFVNLLGNDSAKDINGINNGYPILRKTIIP